MRKFLYLFVLIGFMINASMVYAASKKDEVTPPKEWTTWLESLKREMRARGISQETIDKAYKGKNYYHKAPEVVKLDKKQTEFVLTTAAYVNRLVSKQRVKAARKNYAQLKKKYKNIEKEYNVPFNYITAFWAVETNFGQNKGKHNLIDSLTNLSYKNRRAKFFKNELYNVLKIMDKTNLSEKKMLGSWAGAMGHFQFMPSTYNGYAVDYDGDKVPDIWNSLPDAIASAENYLTKLGWKKDEPWGMRVQLPWDFDFKEVGRQNKKTVADWKKAGILTFAGKELPYDEMKGSIILPDGRKGPAYIVFGNFNRVMIWNRSDNYALAVVTLADYIADQNKKWQPLEATGQYVMNNEEIELIQKFYNKTVRGTKLKTDGRLGPKTREAVKILQRRAKMPADGYPDYRLLNKIKNYDPKIGFSIPVNERKPKKK